MVRTRGGATFKKRRGLRSSTGVTLQDIGEEEHMDADTNRDKGKQREIVKDVEFDKDAWISKWPVRPKKGLKKKTITKKKNPSIAISYGIIDCWALLLNENQKSSAHGPQKLYFGASQSAFLLEVANKDNNTQDIDKLFDIWSRWMFIPCNDFDLANVELEEKLQFIDNMSYDTKYMNEVEKFSDVLSDMLSTFLDQHLPQSNDSMKNMIEYTLESPSLNRKSGKQTNDCGIYTMVSMLHFDGADVFNYDVLRTVAIRRVLRAQIAATLVLTDMNIVRDEVLKKLYEFRSIRSQLARDFVDGRKKKTKQGKKAKKV